MKIFRLILVALLVLFANMSAFSQDKKVEVGLAGGYSYTVPKLKGSKVHDNLPGFHIGPTFKFNIDERFSIRTGVFYNYFSGVNITNSMLKLKDATGIWNQTKTLASSIDFPVRVAMQAPLAEDLYFFVMVGPNLSYGLDKTVSTEFYTDKKLRRTDKGENIYDSEDYQKLDLQIGAAMGLQWRSLFLQGSHDWGILDRNLTDDVTLRNNDIKVTIGYYF